MKQKIGPELARVLKKRIASALEEAKYYPRLVEDVQARALKVIEPYLERSDRERRTDIREHDAD